MCDAGWNGCIMTVLMVDLTFDIAGGDIMGEPKIVCKCMDLKCNYFIRSVHRVIGDSGKYMRTWYECAPVKTF